MTVITRAELPRLPTKYVEPQTVAPPPEPAPALNIARDEFETASAPVRAAAVGAKLLWTEPAVDTQRERGIEQGGLSNEQAELNRSLAGMLDPEVQVDARVLSAIADEAGIPPERQDAAQLAAAAAYIGRAANPEEQQGRLAKALDNLAIADTIGAPKLQEKEFVELMWHAARIPGHAIDQLPADRQAKAYQQIASALDTPGKHEMKVEGYNVKLSVDGTGKVTDSSTKKPSPWKMIGKIALNVGLGIATAFTGGAALAIAKTVQLGMSAYNGIKSAVKGDWLGAISGFAGAFAGGASAATGTASTATRIATTVARGATAANGAVTAVKTHSVAGLLGAAVDGLGVASSFAPNSAGLTRAINVTNRAATGAAAVESAARGDVVGAIQAGKAFATDVFTPKQKPLLQARSLIGVAQLAPAVTGTNVSGQPLLEARSLIGIAALAPAIRGTSLQTAALKSQPSQQVKELQNALRSVGLNVQADGVMGPKTQAALKQFQTENGLKATGALDTATLRALSTERDVGYADPSKVESEASLRFKLGLAKAEVSLRLDKEQFLAEELLRNGNRGNMAAHAAEQYLKAIAYSRSELAKANSGPELEAAVYAMRTPAKVLQDMVTIDKNLNRDVLEVGKMWLGTATTTVGWFCPPLAFAGPAWSAIETMLTTEGSLKDKLVATGGAQLQDYLLGQIAGRFGGAVAKQFEQHMTTETMELLADRIENGLSRGRDVKDIIQEWIALPESARGTSAPQ